MAVDSASTSPVIFVYESLERGSIGIELERLGWQPRIVAGNIEEVLTIRPDLWVMDLGAVTVDAFLLVRAFSRLQSQVPLLLVVQDQYLQMHNDRMLSLPDEWSGPLDFLSTSRLGDELRIRVSWLLGRVSEGAHSQVFHVGALRLDAHRHLATFDSKAAKLTRSEFHILLALMDAKGGAVPKETLAQLLPGQGRQAAQNVEGHLSRLRQKLVRLGMNPKGIQAVRGIGYQLEAQHLHGPRKS